MFCEYKKSQMYFSRHFCIADEVHMAGDITVSIILSMYFPLTVTYSWMKIIDWGS